ncbi:hypothetical protein JHK82_048159 [Glycine max]|nr:hypothetical protein JHK82_048159 [Glycine max]
MSNDINLEGNGRSTSVWPSGLEKEKGRPSKPVKEIENNKSTWPIVRCGRPKGSRNKKIKLAGQDKDSEVMLADIVLCPTHLRRVATCVVGEENTAGSAKYGDEDDKNCVKPKGYKNKVGETANNFDKGGKTQKEGRISAESASRNVIGGEKKNYSQQRGFRITRQTIKQSQSRGLKGKTPVVVTIADENEPNGVTHRSMTKARGQSLKNRKCDNGKKKEARTLRYPDKTREEIETGCPFCLGNCNCRLCLKEDTSVLTGTSEADIDVK